jgi:hypothetical protein
MLILLKKEVETRAGLEPLDRVLARLRRAVKTRKKLLEWETVVRDVLGTYACGESGERSAEGKKKKKNYGVSLQTQ